MQPTLPLHPAQYDVLKAQLIDIEDPSYNVGGYIKLKGQLVKEKFTEAINSAPQSFDAFRMRFHVNETEAVCSFEADYDTMEITELDFSDFPDPEEEAGRWMQQRFNVAFVIPKEKRLFENVLLKIAADEHWFFMRYHHLIMDGYGFVVWLQYLAKKYNVLVAGDDTRLCYPFYANEINKANEYKESSFYRQDGTYWKERISEKPEKILQCRYHNQHNRRSSTFIYNLQDSQKALLEYLKLNTQTSIQQLTIAALLIYFGKTTGVSDLVFGIPLHKRDSKQMRNIVGMFSSILPFKGSYQPDAKLFDFLKEITLAQKRDYRYKNYFFGDLSRHFHFNHGQESLYEIVVNYEPLNFELNFSNEIQATAEKLVSEYERIPLQICWLDFGNQQPLRLQVIFREDYFTQKEIEILTQRILFILEQFPQKLHEETGSIDIIPYEEVQLLKTFNNTEADYPCEKSLVDLFELQVIKTPHRIALSFDDRQLTYQQLNEKANQLSHYLKTKGVKQKELVPICIERSLEMIIGVIAILKSGGTYVPIDPAYPLERIHYMLQDTEAKVVLTSTLSQTKLPTSESVKYITIDKEESFINEQPICNLNTKISPSDLVYVIYTSGSTGKPKGVKMPSANLVNLITWQEQQFKHTYRHVLQFASLNFDVSFQEIFSTLCFGSSLYLITENQRSDMCELYGAIRRYGITHLFVPCIVLKSLAAYITSHSINHQTLETIIVAGEQLQLTNEIKQLLDNNGTTLINQYGPTEAHVVSSFTIDHHYDTSFTLPPIGKPISNACIYILDSHSRLLPVGIAGEICITGTCVAEGYLHNEQLTAEKFVANPFGEGKMYRTGDIGRWLPDGNLEYLGRKDDQVKIRGHRVEIGEIESVLQQCSFVRQCVVIAKEAKDGTKQLVCYVVPKQNFNRSALVSFLESKLPGYMIPSTFIALQSLPVTTNGKVDKRALPAPDSLATDKLMPPRTAMEAALVRIWQEVLGIEQVGINDDFFELGGHSLLVVKTVAKINRQTGRTMSPGSLYQYPTVEKYARFLLEKQGAENIKHIVPIKGGYGKIPLYIVCHIGIAPLSRFIPFAGLLDERQPVFGIHLPEVDQLDISAISIEDIAANYVTELLAHDPQGPYAFAGYSIGGVIAVEMAKQLKKKGKKVAILCLLDTIAYMKELPESSLQRNAVYKNGLQLFGNLEKIAYKLYYKIDNDLYLLRSDTKNTIRSKKNKLIGQIKKLLKIDLALQQKTESQPLWKDLRKISMAAYTKYEPTPYDGNVTLFRAKRRAFYFPDPKFLGWKPYVNAIRTYETEGNHYTMFNPAHRKHLAKLVQQCLDECSSDLGKEIQ